ncbi:MAG: cytochrome P450 [Legionella sp.]|uniref:cytochrome P450 n=1 Tax=Legionella sp. TaxID=459 RepID=UPI0028406BD0|nr:cytochrome P450 [Legionella sp.]
MGYFSFITTPITQLYHGTLELLGEVSIHTINFGRSYIFGDLPELVWHGFNRDWILDECYRRMKNTPERVGRLVVGPYFAPNYQLATLVMAPVPVVASYGENPVDPQAREPFQVMEAAIKRKTIVNLSSNEATHERTKIKSHLSITNRINAETLKLIKQQCANWQVEVDIETQISLVCTNIIAGTVFGLNPITLADIPILKSMSDKIVHSKPGKADFEQASADLLSLSTKLITHSVPTIIQKKLYLFDQIVPQEFEETTFLNLPFLQQMQILQDTHGGAALIVESNLSALCTIALAKIIENPQVKERLVNEINTLPELSDFKALDKLPYLDAVYAEALRFASPTSVIARRTGNKALLEKVVGNDNVERDVPVPKGSYLFSAIRREHFDTDYWANPHEFNPERFTNKVPHFSGPHFFPFSYGPRSCPAGGQFVNVVFKTLIAFVLKNYTLTLDKAVEDIPVNALHPRWTNKYYVTQFQENTAAPSSMSMGES